MLGRAGPGYLSVVPALSQQHPSSQCLTGDTPTCQRRDPTVPGLTVGDSKLPS